MAPRGRSKKVGLKRIDAAIDALGQLGFSKDQVVRTIDELLKVYGGDEGWTFIEEGTYQVVIDKILEDEEDKQQQIPSDSSMMVQGRRSKNGFSGDMCVASANAMVLAAPATLATSSSVNWKDISCVKHLSSTHSLLLDHQHASAARKPCEENYGQLEIVSGLSDHPSPPQPRRQPSYGWISESESEDEGNQDINSAAHNVRKRKSGWDVPASDMMN